MLIKLGILLALIVLGIISGMLVNYLADVLPWKRRLARPFCTSCDTVQPLVNYFIAPRRCPNCTVPRSWRAWGVELVYIGLALWTFEHPASKLDFWLGWLILVYFGVVVVIDLEHRLILHPVSWAGAALGAIIGLIRNGWLDTLLGGVIGFGVMWLLYQLGEVIMKGFARLRDRTADDIALGFGDVNLSGVLGLILGWPLILWGLVLTALIGAASILCSIFMK